MVKLWRAAKPGEKLGVIVALCVGLVLAIIGLAQLGGGETTETTGPTHTTGKNKPAAGSTPKPPAAPAYLEALQPKEGEDPEPGEVQIGGSDLRSSIFWENVGDPDQDTGFCAGRFECRTVTYELGGRYRHFAAHVGGVTSEYKDDHYDARWWVVLDGHVHQGSFNLNRPPVTVEVSVAGVQEMELRLVSEAESNEPTLAWGNARVS
jgi:NPCBM/NEW2 domain